MGTDISYFAELLSPNGVWEMLDVEFYFGGNRNYELFDILAGVRERGFEQIVAPRGLPQDILQNINSHPAFVCDNDDYNDAYEAFCENCHTPSWLLLQELIDFPWHEKVRTTTGYVDSENYQLRKDAQPYRYTPLSPPHPIRRKPVPEPEWIIVTDAEMEQHLADGTATERMHCLFSNQQSYAVAGRFILENTIPKLTTFGDPNRIRIVFWFDS